MKRTLMFLAAAAALGLNPGLRADDEFKDLTDAQFVEKATMSNSTEIAIGRLAQTRASSPQVKQFAERLVRDHTTVNSQLLRQAGAKQINVPAKIDDKHQAKVDSLGKLQGAEFDREFVKGMCKSHEKGVALFEAEAKNGQDAGLKALAEQTLPTLREHHKMAKDLAAQMNINLDEKDDEDRDQK